MTGPRPRCPTPPWARPLTFPPGPPGLTAAGSWAGRRWGQRSAFSAVPSPSHAASLSLTYLLSSSFPRSVHSSSHCEETATERRGERQRDRKATLRGRLREAGQTDGERDGNRREACARQRDRGRGRDTGGADETEVTRDRGCGGEEMPPGRQRERRETMTQRTSDRYGVRQRNTPNRVSGGGGRGVWWMTGPLFRKAGSPCHLPDDCPEELGPGRRPQPSVSLGGTGMLGQLS